MKKLIFTTAATLLMAMTAQAQLAYNYLRAADDYYKKNDFNSAATYYEKYLVAKGKSVRQESYKPYVATSVSADHKAKPAVSSEQEATYKLAESYRLLHDYQKAAPYYASVMESNQSAYPLAAYYYAVSLRALGKYELAGQVFRQFAAAYTAQDEYTTAAAREIANLDFITKELSKKDLHLYKITKAPTGLNATGASYAPLWLSPDKLVFTSTRPENASDDHGFINRLYTADYEAGNAANIHLLGLEQPAGVHQGSGSVSPDGQVLYFTRWNIAHGKKTASIWLSRKSGESWTVPVALPDAVNVPGANAQQPFVTSDGKYLLFASDRAGSIGGFDLWSATLDGSGLPTAVSNLGEVINTAGNEQAPFYHATTGTLVFSADGRTGMGGYDFFSSRGTVGNWKTPVNMGAPVNSVKDDIYFGSRSNNRNLLDDVLLGSDRDASCCLELFFLHKDRAPRQLSGTIVSCEGGAPVAGATVVVKDPASNTVVATLTTAGDGSYTYSIPEYTRLQVDAKATGYTNGSGQVNAPDDLDAESLATPAICISPVATPPAPITLTDVYYDFDQATLKTESFASLDKLVSMLNEHPTMEIELGAHTDSKGSEKHNKKLSEARAKSVVDYLISKGIDKSRLTWKGFGASLPVAPNTLPDGSDNPEGRALNRRTTFSILKQ
ncbi:Outer membrane protein OmpA [Chitinophaga jiangningensis]|uniref:Outer membrane protein OmpA n=1 Tax=Chitinophaga jiangningensis TaxID=1419482 RepID=A0A1M7N2P1_9BACT|nr:OmpA family protein [Chitinophaga jiangningensis]SHM97771.1 Outer membrane protein OmpA [Chitinophaga jiangningensis]